MLNVDDIFVSFASVVELHLDYIFVFDVLVLSRCISIF